MSSFGVSGMPSALNIASVELQVKAGGAELGASPGMYSPLRPWPVARLAPKSLLEYCQKFVLPTLVLLMEPLASATAA